jgi:hypothetical protein
MPTAPARRLKPGNAIARHESEKPIPVKVTVEKGRGFVRSSVKMAKEDAPYYQTDREVEVLSARFTEDDPPAMVRVSGGLTINQGNFESLRIDCSVTIPCHRSKIEEAYQIASDFVADKVAEEETNWMGQPQAKHKGRGS